MRVRFGQLDENMTDAVLTNCRIKAVFGGLPTQSARVMAEELFIGDLDAKKIKAAIYQTKFWPEYRRDKVYGRGASHGTSSSHSTSTGGSDGMATSTSNSNGMSMSFDDWFSFPQLTGERMESTSSGFNSVSSSSSSWADSSSDGENFSESESVADIPIFFPVPFQELSSVQYYTTEEQLIELTAALKEQFPRHCFIKINGKQTQPLLVPFIESAHGFRESQENFDWYSRWQMEKQDALSPAQVDCLIEARQTALMQATATAQTIEIPNDSASTLSIEATPLLPTKARPTRKQPAAIWNRGASSQKPDIENSPSSEKPPARNAP